MWDTYKTDEHMKIFMEQLNHLTDEDIQSIAKFITIRKLSNRWPYDVIKENLNTSKAFRKYFITRVNNFNVVYDDWKHYAKRNRSNKTTISERDN